MFILVIILGIYSYLIFLIGILGYLYADVIKWITFLCLFSAFFILFRNIKSTILYLYLDLKTNLTNQIAFFCLISILLLICVTSIGVLGPEYGFDALWYHLTLPKIYLSHHEITYIPGGLFYYSAMPKLGEMFYISALVFEGEVLAKVIHFSVGLFSLFALYLFSRKFFSVKISLLICLIYYSNLVVLWESITAYIDLFRVFYEILAVFALIRWISGEGKKWFYISAIMVGLAVATKLIAITSLTLYILLIGFVSYKENIHFFKLLKEIAVYTVLAILVVIPWFVFSYINTGNPLYPVFSGYPLNYSLSMLSLFSFTEAILFLFLKAEDPISPIYIISFPLMIYYFRNMRRELQYISFLSCLSVIFWYITPRTGGGRFILPYLPLYSLLVGEIVRLTWNKKFFRYTLILSIFFTTSISISYRFLANQKYISYLLGHETKSRFLTKHLTFTFGDFYDSDGYFERKLNDSDRVLLYGFHNLYYVNFSFIHSSYIKKGDTFNYIAVQHTDLPMRFRKWRLIYTNTVTGVKLYAKDDYETY